MDVLKEQFIQILATVVTIGASVIGQRVMMYLKQKGILAKLETKREAASIVVTAVEQLYQAEKGPEKLETAKDKLIDILLEHGVSVSESELNLLIESAVNGMNEGLKEGIGEKDE